MLLSNPTELTNDQIKSLPSTPFQIVPAPGAGKFIFPVAAFGILNTLAGRYTNIAGAVWNIEWNGDRGSGAPVLIENYLDTEGISMVNFSFPSTVPGEDSLVGSNPSKGIFSAFPTFENSPLYLRDVWNGVSNYTGGHADNKLKVTVYYVVVDL